MKLGILSDLLAELFITSLKMSLKTQRSRIIKPTSVVDHYKTWNIIELQRRIKFAVIGNLILPSAKHEDSHQ